MVAVEVGVDLLVGVGGDDVLNVGKELVGGGVDDGGRHGSGEAME